jgi:hypothetical protein
MLLSECKDILNCGVKCDVAVPTEIRVVNVICELIDEIGRLDRRVAELEGKKEAQP